MYTYINNNAKGTTMKTIHFFSPKGGTGTTTTASIFALALSEQGKTIITDKSGHSPNVGAYLSVGIYEPSRLYQVNPNLNACTGGIYYGGEHPYGDDTDFMVYDWGTKHPGRDFAVEHGEEVIMVVRNDYFCMKACIDEKLDKNDYVLVLNPDGVLTQNDIAQVMRREPVAVSHLDPKVARANDAGLLSTRYNNLEALMGLNDHAGVVASKSEALA